MTGTPHLCYRRLSFTPPLHSSFLSPIPPSGRNGTSERKREREVSERPASLTSRRSVHTVHSLHPYAPQAEERSDDWE